MIKKCFMLLSLFAVSIGYAQKIEGKLFDKGTNLPIADGEVTFFDEGGKRIATVFTDTEGLYVFEPKDIKVVQKVMGTADNYNKSEIKFEYFSDNIEANFGLYSKDYVAPKAVANANNTAATKTTIVVNAPALKGEVAKVAQTVEVNPSKVDAVATAMTVENTVATATVAPVVRTEVSVDKGTAVATQVSSLPYFYYDFNSSYLSAANRPIVEDILAYLRANPTAKMQVRSFLVTKGNKTYNAWMAERRVNRVIDYLVEHGIDRSRLVPVITEVSAEYQIQTRHGKYGGKPAESRRCDFILI